MQLCPEAVIYWWQGAHTVGEGGSHCKQAVCWGTGSGCLTGAGGRWMCLGFPAPPVTPRAFSSRNAKQMPAAVAEALQSVLQLEGGLSPSEAEEYLSALERSQRFQSETWS